MLEMEKQSASPCLEHLKMGFEVLSVLWPLKLIIFIICADCVGGFAAHVFAVAIAWMTKKIKVKNFS